MKIEGGYLVIDAREDWSVLGHVQQGDQNLGTGQWRDYPNYAMGAEYKVHAPFSVRRPVEETHRELLERGEEILRQSRSIHPAVTLLIHIIFIVGAVDHVIDDRWRAFWYRRKLMRILRDHDREMRKLGYKGP